jgi:hypothetical protein
VEEAMKQAPDMVKMSFDDWVDLLTHTNHLELLSNPYDVWIEAFHVGSILERRNCAHQIRTSLGLISSEDFDDDTTMSVTDIKQMQIGLIKKVLEILEPTAQTQALPKVGAAPLD